MIKEILNVAGKHYGHGNEVIHGCIWLWFPDVSPAQEAVEELNYLGYQTFRCGCSVRVEYDETTGN